jgi:hypothetical protein
MDEVFGDNSGNEEKDVLKAATLGIESIYPKAKAESGGVLETP